MTWRDVQLGDIVEFFDYERIPLSTLEREKRQGEYRYYGAQGVIDYIDEYIFDGEYVLVAEDGANLVTRNQPIAFLVDGKFWVNNHAHILKGKSGLTTNYYIKSLLNNISISGYVTGAAQPKLNQKNLKSVRVTLPSYSVQNKIASILSTYDDLIENNNRRIALLEESARLLYREWFVRLRFPGHENTRITDGVPEGWERVKVGDVITFHYGKSLKQSIRIPGPYPVYGSSGIVGTHNKPLIKGPGIIVGRKGNVGSVFWSKDDFFPIDTVYFVDAENSSYYLYHNLKCQNFISSDVAVPGLNRNFAYSLPMLIPATEIINMFEQLVKPNFDQIETLNAMNQKLKTARDLLLPKLMNGEIPV